MYLVEESCPLRRHLLLLPHRKTAKVASTTSSSPGTAAGIQAGDGRGHAVSAKGKGL